ncbi:hypothetical protein [Flavonifractor sp. An9]|nr:hypothetical protein [Flavonifractor sp. An9]
MPRLSKTEWIAFVAATVAGACLHLFTFLPPNGLLFTDLSGTPTWVTLPC